MIDLFKSLNIILGEDGKKFLFASLVLILVVLIEVFGLGLISFLIINISDLPLAINNSFILSKLFSLFSLPSEDSIIILSIFIVIYSIFSVIISSIALNKLSIFAQVLGGRVKSRIAAYFLNLEWKKIVSSKSSKNISRVINDGEEVSYVINFSMLLLSRLVLTAVIVSFLFVFNPVVTFFLVFILSLSYLVIFLLFRSKYTINGIKTSQGLDKSLNMMTNMFGSMKEIIFFGSQKKVLSNLEENYIDLAHVKGNNTALSQMPRFFIDSIILIILVVGVALATGVQGDLSYFFTTVSIYGIAALKLLPAFQNIFYHSSEITQRKPHVSNVYELLIEKDRYEDIEKEEVKFNGEIFFDNVSYSWGGSENKQDSLFNLKIKKGEKIAIIGPTGSGKSTFIDLLLGLVEPESGGIYIDDVKINRKNLNSYRKIFAFVPQKIFFLEDSMKENILFGSKSEITKNTLLEKVTRELKFDLLFNNNKNLHSNLSDSHQTVSGGQKQVIGLARALYRGGDILVMDEATSAMDTKLEKGIFEAIPNFSFSNLVYVTHRPNLLKEFDAIYIFSNFKIEDFGTFEELKERNDYLLNLLKDKR